MGGDVPLLAWLSEDTNSAPDRTDHQQSVKWCLLIKHKMSTTLLYMACPSFDIIKKIINNALEMPVPTYDYANIILIIIIIIMIIIIINPT